MTTAELAAYNAGVAAMIALARATSDKLAARIPEKPTRYNFAIGALDGLAEEGAPMMRSISAERQDAEAVAAE